MFYFLTVPQGQAAAIWDRNGRRTIVKGPRRLALWRKRFELLKQFIADPQQYLVIRHRDGRVQHLRGPGVEWLDPVDHLAITVAPAVSLDASESLVVYRQMPGQVDRRVVRGPALFVPDPDEWLHEFRWHGSDPSDPRRKVPRALKFTKLRVIPDQTYVDVEDVRTADDALLVVKLMLFFELTDIERMLDRTHDPVADFVNAVSADVIDFAATRTFEQFKEQTEHLNALGTYSQLSKRAATIGYRIDKVVYRGYQANPKLQTMHDAAIEARTRLKLEAETERQAQELADLRLAREQERSVKRQEMDRADAEQKIRLARITHDEQLRQKQIEHEAQLRQKQAEHDNQIRQKDAANDADLRATRARDELRRESRATSYKQRTEYLQTIRGLQVDLTQYLTARHNRPDRLIKIDSAGPRRAQMHLHQEAT